jgi:Glyoxalase/Bleomycin resistance protein/Dioxygenase superfamily
MSRFCDPDPAEVHEAPLLKLNFISRGALEVRDLQASRRFYEEVLGFEVSQRTPPWCPSWSTEVLHSVRRASSSRRRRMLRRRAHGAAAGRLLHSRRLTREKGMKRSMVGVAVVVALLALTPLPGRAAEATVTTVGGSWANGVPLVFTSLDPDTGKFSGILSSTWQGSWTGLTHAVVEGVMDRATGDIRGTITETFVGLADRSSGSLEFTESFTFEGATGALLIEADIVSGSGDPAFRCSSGHVSFDGIALPPAGPAFGGWRGSWKHGC